MGLFVIKTSGEHINNVKAAISNLDIYLRSLETGNPSMYLLGMAKDCISEAQKTQVIAEKERHGMRRMVTVKNLSEAPREIWVEWSVANNGSDPVMEFEHNEDPGTIQAVRYIRDDVEIETED